jgi:hypothetical protein
MTFAADPKPMSRTSAILYAISLPLGLAALVFLPAGRIDWTAGWIFIAVLVSAFGLSALLLARVNPMIYRARSRFQPGTEKWDLILLAVMLPAIVIEIAQPLHGRRARERCLLSLEAEDISDHIIGSRLGNYKIRHSVVPRTKKNSQRKRRGR